MLGKQACRIINIVNICVLAICRTAARTKADGHHASYKPITMDDMPVPKMAWNDYHGKQNAKYNTTLAVGFVSLVASIYIVSV